MELTPQTLHAVEFREARRGGYNTRDVDDFIERVSAGVGDLLERLRDATSRADATEARLREVQRHLEEVQRRPPPPAETSDADDTLRRTLVLAQRTADATVKEAKEEANRMLAEARGELERARAAAEEKARHEVREARERAEAEVDELLSTRDALEADIEALRRVLRQQRDSIRSGVETLRRAIDSPASLAEVEVPRLSEVNARPQAGAQRGGEAPGPRTPGESRPAGGSSTSGSAPAPPAQTGPRYDIFAPAADSTIRNGHLGESVEPFGAGEQVSALQEPPTGAAPPPLSRRRPPRAPGPPERSGTAQGAGASPGDVPPGSAPPGSVPPGPAPGSVPPGKVSSGTGTPEPPASPFAPGSDSAGPWMPPEPRPPGHEPRGERPDMGDVPPPPPPSPDDFARGVGPGGRPSRPSEWGRAIFDDGGDDDQADRR
ncbi:MAG TPA: DivIVA domain-containing protein [Acidimicrobiales bacterium]